MCEGAVRARAEPCVTRHDGTRAPPLRSGRGVSLGARYGGGRGNADAFEPGEDAASRLRAGKAAAIASPGRDLSAGLPEEVQTVVQPQPDGTGGAVRAALPLLEAAETVLVLSGDVPLISAATIAALLEAHAGSDAAATMLT